MKTHSKRLIKQKEKIGNKQYSPIEAINLLKAISNVSFDESLEAHISLNVDPKYNDQQLRSTLVLPSGTGKNIKVAVVTGDNDLEKAKQTDADLVGSTDLIDQLSQENFNFDILIATPDQMPKLAKLGKILGPKGLMPSPKSGTVTNNIQEAVIQFKKGKIEYRADKTGIVHIPFGKVSFSDENLLKNLIAIYQSIEKNKPAGVKGKYFKSFFICSTMSPSIELLISHFKNS